MYGKFASQYIEKLLSANSYNDFIHYISGIV